MRCTPTRRACQYGTPATSRARTSGSRAANRRHSVARQGGGGTCAPGQPARGLAKASLTRHVHLACDDQRCGLPRLGAGLRSGRRCGRLGGDGGRPQQAASLEGWHLACWPRRGPGGRAEGVPRGRHPDTVRVPRETSTPGSGCVRSGLVADGPEGGDVAGIGAAAAAKDGHRRQQRC